MSDLTHDDPVERVARAIRDGMPLEPTWEDWLEQARAAIAAMREPTEAMIEAGDEDNTDTYPGLSRDIWQSMIDAALEKEAADER